MKKVLLGLLLTASIAFGSHHFFFGVLSMVDTYVLVKSWDMDGTADYITVADDASLDLTTAMSLEVVVDVPASPGGLIGPISKRDTNNHSWRLYVSNSTGYLHTTVWNSVANDTVFKEYVVETDLRGAKHQFGFIWDNGTLTVIVDGAAPTVSMPSDDAFTSIGNSSVDIKVGASTNSGSPFRFWDGKIGRALIWSTVLTTANYTSMWNSGNLDVNPTMFGTTVMALLMEVGDTTAADGVIDASGNANHGSTVSMVDGDLIDF